MPLGCLEGGLGVVGSASAHSFLSRVHGADFGGGVCYFCTVAGSGSNLQILLLQTVGPYFVEIFRPRNSVQVISPPGIGATCCPARKLFEGNTGPRISVVRKRMRTRRSQRYLTHKKQPPLGPYSRIKPRALWWTKGGMLCGHRVPVRRVVTRVGFRVWCVGFRAWCLGFRV